MKEIALQGGLNATVDDSDYERVAGFRWWADIRKRERGDVFYVRRKWKENGAQKSEYLHRRIIGDTAGLDIDHIDGNGLNNTRSNLRVGTRSQNMGNAMKRPCGHPTFKGIFKQKTCNRWRAIIAGKYLGLYKTPEEAARAYDEAARIRFGEFARTNFED